MPTQNSAEQETCRADPGPVEISIDRSQKGGAEFSRCEISSRILKARPENPGADPNRKNAITIHAKTCETEIRCRCSSVERPLACRESFSRDTTHESRRRRVARASRSSSATDNKQVTIHSSLNSKLYTGMSGAPAPAEHTPQQTHYTQQGATDPTTHMPYPLVRTDGTNRPQGCESP